MSWVVLALVGAATLGLVGVLDKAFIHHFARSYRTLLLLIAVVQALIGIVLTAASAWENLTIDAVGWSLLAGGLWAVSAVVFLRVLSYHEVSRAAPVAQTYPIFVAPIAVLLLGEHLEAFHWLAILAAVAGAVLLSSPQDVRFGWLRPDQVFFHLMASSLLSAAAQVSSKLAVDLLPVLQAHGVRALGFATVLLLFSLRREAVREVREMFVARSPALAIFGFNEFVIANASVIATLWAISLGPVSLVAALGSATSLFVFVYSTALGLRFRGLLGEGVSPRTLALKALATALIVAGVAAISLG